MDSIDSTSNLKNKNIFLVSGSKDTVVVTGVVQKSQSFFKHYGSNVNLKIIQGILKKKIKQKPKQLKLNTEDFLFIKYRDQKYKQFTKRSRACLVYN